MGEVVSRRTSEPRAVSRRVISLHMDWRCCDGSIIIFGMRESRELHLLRGIRGADHADHLSNVEEN